MLSNFTCHRKLEEFKFKLNFVITLQYLDSTRDNIYKVNFLVQQE